jgi:hypothetical protein
MDLLLVLLLLGIKIYASSKLKSESAHDFLDINFQSSP